MPWLDVAIAFDHVTVLLLCHLIRVAHGSILLVMDCVLCRPTN